MFFFLNGSTTKKKHFLCSSSLCYIFFFIISWFIRLTITSFEFEQQRESHPRRVDVWLLSHEPETLWAHSCNLTAALEKTFQFSASEQKKHVNNFTNRNKAVVKCLLVFQAIICDSRNFAISDTSLGKLEGVLIHWTVVLW